MSTITYPLDPAFFLRRRKQIRRELEAQGGLVECRVAVLGGVTTAELVSNLEVFLLSRGIRASFYEGSFGHFYEDAVVDSSALIDFQPDIVYVCTTSRNAQNLPALLDSQEQVDLHAEAELSRFRSIWSSLQRQLPNSTILQNNFDPLPVSGLGNLSATALYGKANFLNRLNAEFAAAARSNAKLLIVDLNGVATQVGMNQWFSPQYWYSYKMPWTPNGIVVLANSVSALVAASYGRTKKCLVLDLDNTLWGGVIGDDGMDNLQLGRETPLGEAYSAFQTYCKALKDRGVILAVCSKNNIETAQSGFSHPDSVLALTDFAAFHANWEPKHQNIEAIAKDLNIGLDSLVFVDDNPAERAIVSAQLPMVMVPEVGDDVSRFPEILESTGYFEAISISTEDTQRAHLYADNAQRTTFQSAFANYGEYLASLEMEAEIAPFTSTYLDRIAQLTNKSNQFNLTTRRYSRAELESLATRTDYVTLYGRLRDRFGDNGLVSVVLGHFDNNSCHIDLWLMSCRVLRRDMEFAMLDSLVAQARAKGVTRLLGYYYRTAKNDMVSEHYSALGFQCVHQEAEKSEWELEIGDESYRPRNHYITIKDTDLGTREHFVAAAANLS